MPSRVPLGRGAHDRKIRSENSRFTIVKILTYKQKNLVVKVTQWKLPLGMKVKQGVE